jgi:hypothetical protein
MGDESEFKCLAQDSELRDTVITEMDFQMLLMSLLAPSVGLVLSDGIHLLVSLRESTRGLYGAGLGCFAIFAFLSETAVIVRNRVIFK